MSGVLKILYNDASSRPELLGKEVLICDDAIFVSNTPDIAMELFAKKSLLFIITTFMLLILLPVF